MSPNLSLLLAGNQLKRTARTGWFMRGVPNAEDVAAHSYGVTWAVLLLANAIEQETEQRFDRGKLLSLAIIHDLPEGKTTDVPAPVWRLLPEGLKGDVERGVMEQLTAESPHEAWLMPLWGEVSAKQSAEAKLVHDADKIDMYLQAWQYERQFGNQLLQEFWDKVPKLNFEASRQIYKEILEQRD